MPQSNLDHLEDWPILSLLMEIKIISSNIRFDNPADNQHSWNNRKSILADLLNSEEADIICTQEGRRPQLMELNTLLKGKDIIEQHREWINERMYPSIYINTDRFFVEESGDVWLSETPNQPGSKSFNSAFPRLCTWAKLALKENGREIFIVNCHLDHCFSETRVEQIKVLLEETFSINSSNEALILCGDFNEGPDGEVRKTLREQRENLFDPWSFHEKEEETTYHKFKGTLKEGARIDWIMLDQRFESLEIKICKENLDNIYPSDHFPIISRVKI